MCTQLSADSLLGPQVASSLRYCQLEREEMEGGRKTGREGGRERRNEGKGVMRRVVAGVGEKKARGKESLAGRDAAESDGKRLGQGGSVLERCRQTRYKIEDGFYCVENVDDLDSDALAIAPPRACSQHTLVLFEVTGKLVRDVDNK